MSDVSQRQPLLPQSLNGRFLLAQVAVMLLIMSGSGIALYALHVSAENSRQLAEERLERLQDSQRLLQHAVLIARQSQLISTTSVPELLQTSHSRILTLLNSLDNIVIRIGRSQNGTEILDIHQASQLFRNTIHIISRLREKALDDRNISEQRRNALMKKVVRFRQQLERQIKAMANTLETLSEHIIVEYREAVVMALDEIRYRQLLVLAIAIASLILTWLITHHFRRHAVDRLGQVSHYLRSGKTDDSPVSVPVRGDDEIGKMARAVEQFLEDRQQLVNSRQELAEREEMLLAITNAVQSAVVLLDEDDRFRFINPAAEKLFGYSFKELDGRKAHETLVPEQLRKKAREGLLSFSCTGSGPALEQPNELVALRKDGSEVHIELRVGRIRRNNRWWAVGACIDNSVRKLREEKLEYLAETDPLTGLKNRRSFVDLADLELKRSLREGQPLFFLMFDLDNFKEINDTHGHVVGDLVLREFSKIMSSNLRETDLFGRIGGEEFAAVLTAGDLHIARHLAERIREAFFNHKVQHKGVTLNIRTGVSIGLTEANPARDTVESALERADTALYRAKTEGRNRVVVKEEIKQTA
jgi:two-component system, cell cycle response regulator